jgi:DinB superfamily/Pentapeptide repeats (8 copies)
MSDFVDVDLSEARFEHVRLARASFRDCDLTGVQLRGVDLTGVVMRGVDLVDAEIYGDITGLVVNGVDVSDLITRELDRRHPDRTAMRPIDPAGFRHAWDIIERLWAGTVQRARGLDPDRLHESVRGEWSFIETLRHLVFATDAWIRRAILGDPSPWDPLDLPWDEMPDTPGIPRDRTARPSLDTVLALRHDRMATVRSLVDGLSDESLAADTTPVEEPGWPHRRSYPVRQCLLIILNEEWEHRLYAERDLDTLM